MTALKKYCVQITCAAAALLLLAGSVWSFRYWQREKQVHQITKKGNDLAEESMKRMNALIEQASSRAFSPAQFLSMQDDQRERFGELRKEMEKLPPELQKRVRLETTRAFVKQMNKVAAELLKKPKQEQDVIFDALITLMQMGQKNNPSGRRRMAAVSSGAESPPGQGRRATSAENRDHFHRQILDITTPEERARLSAAMQLFQQRLRERGLPVR